MKFLTILGLAAFLSLAGCKSAATNTNMMAGNTNMMAGNTNMMVAATPMAAMTPAMDMATKATVESALAKAGITGVTVEANTTNVILRGSVAKGKMAEAVRIATESGKKPVKNDLTEK